MTAVERDRAVATATAGAASGRLSRAFGTGAALPLAAHRRTFAQPPRAGLQPDLSIVDAAERSGLRGRGGAGFPLATKLRAVAARRGPAVVVANGSEGEPMSAKDKTLLTLAPHLVLDGVQLAAAAVGASGAVVAVERGTAALEVVRAALAERAGDGIPVRLIDVPARFVAGEESALVHLVNGGDAKPTLTPPRPFEQGVGGRPTLVSNVETLAHLATIARWGPAWFRAAGTDDEPGTALVTVSGAVRQPGVFEVSLGASLAGALAGAGGPTDGVQAVLIGGYYGTWLAGRDAHGARLADGPLRPFGASLGCGALVVLPEAACGLAETARLLAWMAGETAGQCGPCVHGLRAIAGAAADLAAGRDATNAVRLLHRWAEQVDGRGACSFPDGAVRLLRNALTVFADDVARHTLAPCAHAAGPARLHIPTGGAPWR